MTSQTGGNKSEYNAKQAAKAYINDHTKLDAIEDAFTTAQTGFDEKVRQSILALVSINRHLLEAAKFSVRTLTNGDDSSTTISSSYYWLWPRNATPYWAIRLKDSQTTYSWERDAGYFISVAGTWGWSATCPDDVKHACIRYAGYLYAQKDSGVFDVTTFPESGVITTPQGIPRDVKVLLAKYVRGPG